jgi:Ion channel
MTHFEFRYAEQFIVALALTSLTVLIHSVGMSLSGRYIRRFPSLAKDHGPSRRNQQVMVGIVAIMMGTHFVEVLIWAFFYWLRGVVPERLSAVYFSVANYTTVGASGITVPDHWQGIGSFEAMAAMLMFGWSTAVLAAVVVKLISLDT